MKDANLQEKGLVTAAAKDSDLEEKYMLTTAGGFFLLIIIGIVIGAIRLNF